MKCFLIFCLFCFGGIKHAFSQNNVTYKATSFDLFFNKRGSNSPQTIDQGICNLEITVDKKEKEIAIINESGTVLNFYTIIEIVPPKTSDNSNSTTFKCIADDKRLRHIMFISKGNKFEIYIGTNIILHDPIYRFTAYLKN